MKRHGDFCSARVCGACVFFGEYAFWQGDAQAFFVCTQGVRALFCFAFGEACDAVRHSEVVRGRISERERYGLVLVAAQV